ncbi:hypothetical protein ACLB2K_013281 [Fragaria x ananassa]
MFNNSCSSILAPPLNIPLPPQLTSQFNCTINSTVNSINYYVTEDLTNFGISNISSSFGTCNTTVIVPVSQSAASDLALNTSEENLADALDSGFNLMWDASNTLCQQCQGSGGQCGYNTSSTEFTCYCKDGPNPSNCGGMNATKQTNFSIFYHEFFESISHFLSQFDDREQSDMPVTHVEASVITLWYTNVVMF